ncbi:hypothetical protein DVH24_012761 [Malus domestica]|uniref:Uncharacterized protein n=1 Tax=Malus domestica TaxID=3750 RepID=A0A498HUA4_MALDO|nr:hypothetical protein DVH24_012761 [Malus domestica]
MVPKSDGEALKKSVEDGKKGQVLIFTVSPNSLLTSFSVESNAGTAKDDSEDEVMNLSVASDVCFIITAFTFLLLPYFVMSTWFIWVLIILFCIGGIEEMHNCVLSVILRYI